MTNYECPLCGTDFTGAECHSSCPMSKGCTMVRCPHCAYEFVESGKIADMLRRWIRRAPKCSGPLSIVDLPIGASAPVASIAPTSAARVNRLASYGIVPGSEIRLVSRRPAVVVECGPASVALEDDIAREILVAPVA
jgi:Fe2+ transport system protein FeoA/DNA-directed RNA polymerase subunit RPC12/RpoP